MLMTNFSMRASKPQTSGGVWTGEERLAWYIRHLRHNTSPDSLGWLPGLNLWPWKTQKNVPLHPRKGSFFRLIRKAYTAQFPIFWAVNHRYLAEFEPIRQENDGCLKSIKVVLIVKDGRSSRFPYRSWKATKVSPMFHLMSFWVLANRGLSIYYKI